jgi:hypothetical protein
MGLARSMFWSFLPEQPIDSVQEDIYNNRSNEERLPAVVQVFLESAHMINIRNSHLQN